MKNYDFLIVGGSAAGTTAAEVIRTLKPDSSIAIINDDDNFQYSKVLMPHYVRHKVKREQVFLKNAAWYLEKKIDYFRKTKVVKVDANERCVETNTGEVFGFEKLLFAVGGNVIELDVPGAEANNILYLRTIEDGDKIINLSSKSKKAIIVGGGFIGLEFASCFKANGIEDITILVREDYFWSSKLDKQSCEALLNVLERNGIKVVVGEEVSHFETDGGDASAIITKSGRRFEGDIFGVGVGILCEVDYLKRAGISVNRGILANEYLETNVSGIFTAGDCAEFEDVIFQRQHLVGNWANATAQGSVVAKNMCGIPTVFETASSYSINFFEGPPNGGTCSFLGVTDSSFADKIILRADVSQNKVTRIFVKNIDEITRVVGATVINSAGDVAPLTVAIKNKLDVSDYLDKLEDINFSLNDVKSS